MGRPMEKFTKYKTMIFPREVIVGHNTTDQIKDLCKRLTSREHFLIVTDRNTKRISGDRIEKILSGAGFEVNHATIPLPRVRKDIPVAWPSIKEVNHVIKIATHLSST